MDACRSAEEPVTAPGGQPAAGPLRPDDPSELGHYRVLGRLGEGGVGTVFLGAADLERVAVSVAAALTAIHGAGLVHRDLKPANVLLSSLGPRVIDFGIAHAADITHVTRDSIVGTPAFMAPEQALAQPVSGAADVWAWAGLVAFAGTGRLPFGDGPPEAQIFRIVHGDPNLDGLDPALGTVVRRAMSRQPTDRPTAQDLLQQLVTLGVEVPASATSALALPAAAGGTPPQGRAPASDPIPPTSPAGPSSSPSSPSAARRTRPEHRPSGRMLDDRPAGSVIGMHPAAGSEVSRDAAIELDVSDGPGHTTVPDLVGRSEVDARSGLYSAGLVMVIQENSGPSSSPSCRGRASSPGGRPSRSP
ncbi:hypothetical protein BBK14_08780 [Parafrankia soli]|uniref:non-specific serine/threonine protein kinase n=1 Tax=Parafrankia soli TaxID=2599596 RepID=A0A1S1PGA3_9ACTN|nr:hypothetical protein BBK14_08780 [Parafrankia soli]